MYRVTRKISIVTLRYAYCLSDLSYYLLRLASDLQKNGKCCRTRGTHVSMITSPSLSCFDDQDLPAAIFSDGVIVEKTLDYP